MQGGFAKCYELTDTETKEILAGKIISKTMLEKPHQKEKVSGRPLHKTRPYTRCRVCVHYSSAQSDILLIVKLLSDFVVDVNGDRYS